MRKELGYVLNMSSQNERKEDVIVVVAFDKAGMVIHTYVPSKTLNM